MVLPQREDCPGYPLKDFVTGAVLQTLEQIVFTRPVNDPNACARVILDWLLGLPKGARHIVNGIAAEATSRLDDLCPKLRIPLPQFPWENTSDGSFAGRLEVVPDLGGQEGVPLCPLFRRPAGH